MASLPLLLPLPALDLPAGVVQGVEGTRLDDDDDDAEDEDEEGGEEGGLGQFTGVVLVNGDCRC
jgi:hypothetical protein